MKCGSGITYLFLTLIAPAVLSAQSDECGLINPVQFENNQRITQIDEFPWMARVAFNETTTSKIAFYCQAILISQQHLITVAHCIREMPDREAFAVALGDWDSSNIISAEDCDDNKKCSTPALIEIDQIIVHPFYSSRKRKNDICVLRLTKAVTYTDYIRPICLPDDDVKTKEFGSEELMFTGWVRNEEGQKRKLPVVIFNQLDCRRKYADIRHINITDEFICGITCDENLTPLSGSALMDVKSYENSSPRNVYLVGIDAYGSSYCGTRMPDILVRVDKYLDWIKENMY